MLYAVVVLIGFLQSGELYCIEGSLAGERGAKVTRDRSAAEEVMEARG